MADESLDTCNSWEADAARLKAANVKRQDQMREGPRIQERTDRLGYAVERVRSVCSRSDVERTDGRRELAAGLLDLAHCCREIGIADRVNLLNPQTDAARCAVRIFEAAVSGNSDNVEKLLQEAGEGFPPASLIDMTNILGDIGWTLWNGLTLWNGQTMEPIPANPATRQDDDTTGESTANAATTPPAVPSSEAKPVDDVATVVRRVSLLLGADGGKIMAVVAHSEFTTDQKLRALGKLDERFQGYKSDDLAELLGVSPASIRNSSAWKEWNPKPTKREKSAQK